MAIEIKFLGPEDAGVLANVAPDVFDDAIDIRRAIEFLTDPRHHLAVGIEGGLVVGFVSAVHYVHPDKPRPELWINEIGVAATHRGLGLGTRLLRALLDVAHGLGCAEAWVLTDRANTPAMRLYAAAGSTEGPTDHVMFTFKLDAGEANTLRLGQRVFPIAIATFFRLSRPEEERPRWQFEIRTGPPVELADDSQDRFMYGRGVRLYAEADPIPLPAIDDLTGVELYLPEPFDRKYNDPYFTLYVQEHAEVSDVRLRFAERRGESYRLHLTGLAHHVEQEPLPLEVATWIEWRKAGEAVLPS